MNKISNERFVCTAAQAQQLMGLGIVPSACFCYQWLVGDIPEEAHYEFAGEYMGETGCIPAWTIEELSILIGGDYKKPDTYSTSEWRDKANMNNFICYTPKSRREFASGAQAYAAFLEFLLTTKELKAEDCNKRLSAYAAGEHYNALTEQLIKEANEKKKL